MTTSPIVEYLKKKNELQKTFKKLQKKRYSDIKGSIVLGISFLFSIVALFSAPFIYFEILPIKINEIVPFVFLFISFLFYRFYLYLEILEIRKNYPQYVELLSTKPRKNLLRLIDKRSFLIVLYSEKMSEEVERLSISPGQLEQYIDDYTKTAEKTKNHKWYTIAILGLFMFSIWSEFVGAIFGRETSVDGLLNVGLIYLFASIVITFIVSFYKVSIEQVLLRESGNYLMLSEVLKIVKNQM